VCALLWRILGKSSLEGDSSVRSALQSLSPAAIIKIIQQIRHTITINRQSSDEELQNHARFLELAENYQLLKYAIKHGDIGLIRLVIDRCCIYFHGSGQHKYALEMLHLQRLLSTSAASPPLQRAILANSLVNFRGCHDSWLETDRMIELHNGDMKQMLKARRGSSMTVERLFEYCSLNAPYFVCLQREIECIFGVTRIKADHTTKSAQRDVIIMAKRLSKSSLALTPGRRTNHVAPDLINEGGRRLSDDGLQKFNDRTCSYLIDGFNDNGEPEEPPLEVFELGNEADI